MKPVVVTLFAVFALSPPAAQTGLPRALADLAQTERDFATRATETGWRSAFIEFYAADAVAFGRGATDQAGVPLPARAQLRSKPSQPHSVEELTWEPRVGDVSADGALGWLSGPSAYRDHRDATAPVEYGNYLSLWKRQPDGQWRSISDVGTAVPAPAPFPAGFHRFEFSGQHPGATPTVDATSRLRAADTALNERIEARGAAAAYASVVASRDTRLHRDGANALPAVGPDAIGRWLRSHPAPTAALTTGAEAAASGDLGYAYGRYDVSGGATETGSYVRVWVRDKTGNWMLAAEATTPLAAAASAPAPFQLPAPTGRFAVGTTSWHVTDPARIETLAEPTADAPRPREVQVLAWYPAATPVSGPRAPYLRDGLREVQTLATLLGAPSAFDGLSTVATNGRLDAAPNAGALLPLLIFSHGYTGIPSGYTALLEDLASHGYAVLSIVHPYEASATLLSDGRVAEMLNGKGTFLPGLTQVFSEWGAEDRTMAAVTSAPDDAARERVMREYLASLPRTDAALARWVADTALVLDHLSDLPKNTAAGRLASRLDRRRIGVFGHSMGGVTAGAFCVVDARCKAGLNLDGSPQYGAMIDGRMAAPFLMVYSARPGRAGDNDLIYRRAAARYTRVDVARTAHADFSDMGFWGGPLTTRGVVGPIAPVDATRITRTIVREYFDQELLGRRSPLLSGRTSLTGVTVVSVPAQSKAVPGAQDTTSRIGAVVAKMMAEAHVPGTAVAVVRHGRVVYSAGFGRSSIERGVAATATTAFQIGSISKPFTALAVMALVEDGRLKLDDPLSRYLTDTPPAWNAITIRDVLNHTAGLWDWEAADGLKFNREYTPQEFVAIVASHPLDFEPGTKHHYTNSGYPLLGMVIERITGRPFEELVRRRVFDRAGMAATAFWTPAERAESAVGYEWADGAWRRGTIARPRILAPNGGIVSTVLDMARFVRAIRENRIVRRATFDLMLTPPVFADGTASPYGLGWFVQSWMERRVVHHIGETAAGFSSSLQIFPDQDAAVIVLTNGAGVLPVY
ncbi:MAG: serine hydrolase, partial [Vicinamibacterales bacterium]